MPNSTVSPETSAIISGGQEKANPVAPPVEQEDAQAPDIEGGSQTPASAPQVGAAVQGQPAKPAINPAAVADLQRHHALGKLTAALFGNQVQYSTDPTGKVVSTEVPQKPGALFRHILAGAIIGGAASDGTTDFTTGLVRGGAAGVQQQQQQDQQRRAQAQQDFSNEQAVDKQAEERKWREHLVAQSNIENLRHDREMNRYDAEFIDGLNQRANAFATQMEQAGAQPIPINVEGKDINGQAGNASLLIKQDLNNLKAPPGYHTLHTQQIDTTGLSMKDGQWVDGEGKPVDLSTRTAHTIYAVPDNIFNQQFTISGKELNKIAGHDLVDPDSTKILTYGGLIGLETKAGAASLEHAKSFMELEKGRLDIAKAKKELADANANAAGKHTDVFGNTSSLSEKEYNKRYDSFSNSKQRKDLTTLQGSYEQFRDAVQKIDSGQDLTGADSVVGLFNAIGISATPLAGKGFRINENTIKEHANARGIGQAGYQKLLSLKNGDVITPQQLKDYANIAKQVYFNSYIEGANEQRRQLNYIDVLPQGNNQTIDPVTAQMYLRISGGDPVKARQAAQKSGWIVPQAQ